MNLSRSLVGLLALTAACVDTTYATQPDVLHPGPCAVGGLTLRYDDCDRLVEVWEADGKLRERYTYEDDFTFTIEVNTTVYYDPTNSQENLDSVVPVEAKLYAHATIDPVTFEFLISRIDATLPPPYQAGSGQIFYTYTDYNDDGWINHTSASFPVGWRSERTRLNLGADRPSSTIHTSLLWIPEEDYTLITGEETSWGDVLMITDNHGRSYSCGECFAESRNTYDDGVIWLGELESNNPWLCTFNRYGIERCSPYVNVSNDYSPAGNLIRSRDEPREGASGYDVAYDYTCWTSADVCTKWRYVPSDRYITSTLRYTLRHSLYLGIPSMIRMPCEWSWETAARLR